MELDPWDLIHYGKGWAFIPRVMKALGSVNRTMR